MAELKKMKKKEKEEEEGEGESKNWNDFLKCCESEAFIKVEEENFLSLYAPGTTNNIIA